MCSRVYRVQLRIELCKNRHTQQSTCATYVRMCTHTTYMHVRTYATYVYIHSIRTYMYIQNIHVHTYICTCILMYIYSTFMPARSLTCCVGQVNSTDASNRPVEMNCWISDGDRADKHLVMSKNTRKGLPLHEMQGRG